MKELVPKMARGRGSDAGQSIGGGKLDPVEGVAGAARRILPFYPA